MQNETTPGCVQCGSERLTWRVKRARAGGAHDSKRELLWTCGACGHNWSEPLSVRFEAVAEPVG